MKKVWTANFLCMGVLLLTLSGVAVMQTALNSSHLPFETNVFQQGKYDFTALLCSGETPLSRLIRNSRQRYGSQGRLVNTGNGHVPAALFCTDTLLLRDFDGTTCRQDIFVSDLWIDFFNSALPVRAGPFTA